MSAWLGIDIGTCYSSAALMIDGNPQPVKEPLNHGFSFPSSVYLTEQGDLLVGQAAENSRSKDPRRYRREFKRELGSVHPFTLGDRQLLPEELITVVIRKLKQVADEKLRGQGKDEITAAVITIPATYQAHKQNLMEQAAKAAGFNQVVLQAEPVAAALYHTRHAIIESEELLLVYDLGAGTFDATLIRMSANCEILGVPVGLEHCGGMDFDRLIYQDLKAQCSTALAEFLSSQNSTRQSLQVRALVGSLCRDLKHQLSEEQVAEIMIPIAEMESYRLTRQRFNQMITPLVGETLESSSQLLKSAGLTWKQINQVLLVGGSCRIPYIKSAVAQHLGRSPLLVDDPELAVCLGAALHKAEKSQPLPSNSLFEPELETSNHFSSHDPAIDPFERIAVLSKQQHDLPIVSDPFSSFE